MSDTAAQILCRQAQHAGSHLTPPLGDAKRLKRLPKLASADVAVSGSTFKSSNTDVAVGGLGWFGVAAAGDVQLRWILRHTLYTCCSLQGLLLHLYKCTSGVPL